MKSPIFVLKISGGSMKPYAKDGDYAISTNLFLRPKEGQVMVFRSPIDGKVLIKRVKRVEKGNDGKRYFMEGDNRIRSVDSNIFGTVSKQEILGKVIFMARPRRGK